MELRPASSRDIQAIAPNGTQLAPAGALGAGGRRLEIPPQSIAIAAVLAAAIVGVGLAQDAPLGLAALIAFCWAPLVLLNLRMAIVLWVPLIFLHDITALRFGPQLASMIIFFAWIGTLMGSSSVTRAMLSVQRRYLLAAGAFMLWLTLSAAWSTQSAFGSEIWFAWLQATLLFLVVTTTFTSPRHLKLVIAAFAFGALVAVTIGLFGTGLTSNATAIQTASENRFVGGSGDPNYLAAGIIPAVLMLGGLIAVQRNIAWRLVAVVAIGVLTVGFVGAQSRGGLVAAVVAIVASFIVFKRARTAVLCIVLVVVAVAAGWYSANPEAWDRVSDFDSSGTGRSELWEIAVKMGGDHPVVGVGLDNFIVESPRYADRIGTLEHAGFVAETPLVAHNVYLQMYAEEGVIGIALLLAVLGLSIGSAVVGARTFERRGNMPLATLARTVVVAQVAMLAASFFISNGHDRRTWTLLALGPALAVTAARLPGQRRGGPEAPSALPSLKLQG
jgi:O-antigen ligase